MSRKNLFCLVLVVGSVLLAGCGPSGSGNTEAPVEDTEAPIVDSDGGLVTKATTVLTDAVEDAKEDSAKKLHAQLALCKKAKLSDAEVQLLCVVRVDSALQEYEAYAPALANAQARYVEYLTSTCEGAFEGENLTACLSQIADRVAAIE